MGFMDFIDRVSQLATAPVFTAMDSTTGVGDNFRITFGHPANLVRLVRMHHEYDFVMAHLTLPSVCSLPKLLRFKPLGT